MAVTIYKRTLHYATRTHLETCGFTCSYNGILDKFDGICYFQSSSFHCFLRKELLLPIED